MPVSPQQPLGGRGESGGIALGLREVSDGTATYERPMSGNSTTTGFGEEGRTREDPLLDVSSRKKLIL